MNEEFFKVVREFIPDFLTTFPEYESSLDQGILDILEKVDSTKSKEVYTHSVKHITCHLIRILQQDETLFAKDSDVSTEYIKGILFKELWHKDITDQTKDILWKYLQLFGMSIVNYEKDASLFQDQDIGELFKDIDEEEFKRKLEDTLNNMKDFFDGKEDSDISFNQEETKENLDKIMNGKIGTLAKEIAKETLEDMDGNVSEDTMFNSLLKNPLGLIKNIEKTLETKMEKGDLKKEDLMEEAKDIMSQISNMNVPGGMGPLQDIMKNFQSASSGSQANANMSNLNKNMFQQYMNNEQKRQSMREKLEKRQRENQQKNDAKHENTSSMKNAKTKTIYTEDNGPILKTPATNSNQSSKRVESKEDDWDECVKSVFTKDENHKKEKTSLENGKNNKNNKKKKKKKKNKNV